MMTNTEKDYTCRVLRALSTLVLSNTDTVVLPIEGADSIEVCGDVGICHVFAGQNYDTKVALNMAFFAWPKHSGDATFPVPSPLPGVLTKDIYFERLLWDADAYGDLRRELAAFCADWIEQNVTTFEEAA